MSRHQYLNDIIWRSLLKAGVPAVKEPSELTRTDGKRPDGLTQIPWEAGKYATWDVTVIDTLASINIQYSFAKAGAAAERAADRKSAKYTELAAAHTFIPVAIDTLEPINSCGAEFIKRLGLRIRALTVDARESSFLWQRLSNSLQRFNAAYLLGTFETSRDT